MTDEATTSIAESHRFASAGLLRVLRWPALDATGVVDALVTTRHGGVSTGAYESLNLGFHVGDDRAAVLENRSRAAGALGVVLDDMVFCKQAHGANVARITSAERGRGSRSDDDAMLDTDALVTTESVALAVMVADCVPIIMVDPEQRILSCVHAGWRGTTEKVTSAAIEEMVRLGAEPSRLVVGMGPAIPADRYQVGEEVLEAASVTFGDTEGLIAEDGTGRWRFDLWSANQRLLSEAGVEARNVHVARIGTESDDFFSDRAVRPCGRFAAIARLLL